MFSGLTNLLPVVNLNDLQDNEDEDTDVASRGGAPTAESESNPKVSTSTEEWGWDDTPPTPSVTTTGEEPVTISQNTDPQDTATPAASSPAASLDPSLPEESKKNGNNFFGFQGGGAFSLDKMMPSNVDDNTAAEERISVLKKELDEAKWAETTVTEQLKAFQSMVRSSSEAQAIAEKKAATAEEQLKRAKKLLANEKKAKAAAEAKVIEVLAASSSLNDGNSQQVSSSGSAAEDNSAQAPSSWSLKEAELLKDLAEANAKHAAAVEQANVAVAETETVREAGEAALKAAVLEAETAAKAEAEAEDTKTDLLAAATKTAMEDKAAVFAATEAQAVVHATEMSALRETLSEDAFRAQEEAVKAENKRAGAKHNQDMQQMKDELTAELTAAGLAALKEQAIISKSSLDNLVGGKETAALKKNELEKELETSKAALAAAREDGLKAVKDAQDEAAQAMQFLRNETAASMEQAVIDKELVAAASMSELESIKAQLVGAQAGLKTSTETARELAAELSGAKEREEEMRSDRDNLAGGNETATLKVAELEKQLERSKIDLVASQEDSLKAVKDAQEEASQVLQLVEKEAAASAKKAATDSEASMAAATGDRESIKAQLVGAEANLKTATEKATELTAELLAAKEQRDQLKCDAETPAVAAATPLVVPEPSSLEGLSPDAAAALVFEKLRHFASENGRIRSLDLFRALDADRSGALDAQEFKQALARCGLPGASNKVVKAVMKSAGLNEKGGGVPYGAFVAALSSTPRTPLPLPPLSPPLAEDEQVSKASFHQLEVQLQASIDRAQKAENATEIAQANLAAMETGHSKTLASEVEAGVIAISDSSSLAISGTDVPPLPPSPVDGSKKKNKKKKGKNKGITVETADSEASPVIPAGLLSTNTKAPSLVNEVASEPAQQTSSDRGAAAEAELVDLKKQLAESQAAFAAVVPGRSPMTEEETQALQATIEHLTAELAAAKEREDKTRSDLDDLAGGKETATLKVVELEKELERSKNDLVASQEDSLKFAKNAQEEASQALQLVEKEAALSAEKAASGAEASIAAAIGDLESINAQLVDAQANLKSATEKATGLTVELSAAKERENKMRRDLAGGSEIAALEVAELEKQLELSKFDLVASKEDGMKAVKEAQEEASQVLQLVEKEAAASAKRAATDAEASMAAATGDRESIKAQFLGAEANLKTATEKATELTAELLAAKEREEKLRSDWDKLAVGSDTAALEVAKLEKELEQTKIDLVASREDSLKAVKEAQEKAAKDVSAVRKEGKTLLATTVEAEQLKQETLSVNLKEEARTTLEGVQAAALKSLKAAVSAAEKAAIKEAQDEAAGSVMMAEAAADEATETLQLARNQAAAEQEETARNFTAQTDKMTLLETEIMDLKNHESDLNTKLSVAKEHEDKMRSDLGEAAEDRETAALKVAKLEKKLERIKKDLVASREDSLKAAKEAQEKANASAKELQEKMAEALRVAKESGLASVQAAEERGRELLKARQAESVKAVEVSRAECAAASIEAVRNALEKASAEAANEKVVAVRASEKRGIQAIEACKSEAALSKAEVGTALSSAQEEAEAAKRECEQMKSQSAAELASVTFKLRAAEGTASVAQEECASLTAQEKLEKERTVELEAHLVEARERWADFSKQVKEAEQKISDSELVASKAVAAVSKVSEEKKQAEVKVAAVEKQLEGAKLMMGALRKECAGAKAAIHDAQQNSGGSGSGGTEKDEAEAARAAAEAASESLVSQLQKELAEARAEAAAAQAEVAAVSISFQAEKETETEKSAEKAQHLEKEVLALTRELASSHDEVKGLKKKQQSGLVGADDDSNAQATEKQVAAVPINAVVAGSTAVGSSVDNTDQGCDVPSYRERAVAFYEFYGMPHKAAQVDELLAKRRGQEERMMETLVKKYGPEPAPPPLQPASSELKPVPATATQAVVTPALVTPTAGPEQGNVPKKNEVAVSCFRCSDSASAATAAEARAVAAEKALRDSKSVAAASSVSAVADAKAQVGVAEAKRAELEAEVVRLRRQARLLEDNDNDSDNSGGGSHYRGVGGGGGHGLVTPVDTMVAASSVSTCDFGAFDAERGSVSWHVPGTCSGALSPTGFRNKVAGWKKVYAAAAVLLLVGLGRALVGGGQVMASADLGNSEKTTARVHKGAESTKEEVTTSGLDLLVNQEGERKAARSRRIRRSK